MKKKTILLGSVVIMFLVACALNSGVSSEQIGLRKASLENENKVALVDASFTALQPGESVLFERSFEKIRNGEVFDEIFFNEKDELTEGARSNIVVEKDGKFCTPPLECGLLNGIFRQKLIKEGKCTEKILKMPDLIAADAIYCVNSVRGMVKVCF